MSKKLVLLVAVLTITSLAFAQAPSTRVPAHRDLSAARHDVQGAMSANAIAPSTITCAASYASGAGEKRTTDCVTVNGNIVEFSVNGEEMISVGTVDEGYGICDFTGGNVHYFDYGWTDSGNLLPSSFTTPTAKQAVSTRISSDGIWQITNTITQTFATASAPGKVTAKTTVKNLTGIARSIFFLRHADLDANSDTGFFDLSNLFDYGVNTAHGTFIASPTTQGYGLEMLDASYNGTGGVNHNFYSLNDCCSPDPCNAFANISTEGFTGDGSLMGLFGQVVPAGGNKIFTVVYQPI